jgi:hypothetical protein
LFSVKSKAHEALSIVFEKKPKQAWDEEESKCVFAESPAEDKA